MGFVQFPIFCQIKQQKSIKIHIFLTFLFLQFLRNQTNGYVSLCLFLLLNFFMVFH